MEARQAGAGALPSERRRWLVMLAPPEVEWAAERCQYCRASARTVPEDLMKVPACRLAVKQGD